MASNSDLNIGWKVNQGLDPEYWMRPDAEPGKHTQDDLVSISPSSVARHTAVIAQSGSGKSFFLGRLIEEIALKTRARLVVFDPNSDFRRLHDPVSEEYWSPEHSKYDYKKRRGWLSDEEWLPDGKIASTFLDAWNATSIAVHSAGVVKSGKYRPLKLWWPLIPVEFLQEDVDAIGRNDMYHCHAFVRKVAQLAQETGSGTDENLLSEALSLLQLSRSGPENFRKHLDSVFPDPKSKAGDYLDEQKSVALRLLGLNIFKSLSVDKEAAARRRLKDDLANASAFVAEDIARFYFGRAYRTDDSKILNLKIQKGDSYTGEAAQVEVIDLPSINDRSAQILTASTLLEIEWINARLRWAEALEKPKKEDVRAPTLIVVDEAHNLMPSETRGSAETSLREQFRRIAAEGRKYGLFLILVSQRPDKLDPLVLSECENKVVMRLGSESVLNITRELLGLEEVPEKILNKCLEFEQGRGLLLGDWVDGHPTYFYGAARRTVEGGRDLRAEAWAYRVTQQSASTNATSTIQSAKESTSLTSSSSIPSPRKPAPRTPKRKTGKSDK